MDATLAFFYVPVENIQGAAAFYREQLHLEESWREGNGTIAFKLPGTEIDLVVDQVEDGPLSAGPVLQLPSVMDWYQARRGNIDFVGPVSEIPGGSWAIAKDGAGNLVYFVDQTGGS